MIALIAICAHSLAFSETVSPNEYELVRDLADLPILNPSLGERKTAKLRLKNGLEICLISDPGVDQSAAALAVEAGSWNDPKEYPGIAHFLEHMLFMGNAAYPEEFEYMQYITDNGGKVNAYTATERTVYMFSINNAAFVGALDRFSHFFIDPLFSPSSIGRELHAVDQEHSKNIENDGWRQYMIFKETGNPDHPNVGFSTGNAQTLSGIPQEVLKKWYQTYYSSERMHLVVLSSLPINELIDVTVKSFAKVPMRSPAASSITTTMASPKQRGHVIYIKPIKDLRLLSLMWELPPQFAADKEHKVGELLAYVLSNGGENSLLQELKREKVAEGLKVSEDRFGKAHALFNIDITLTEQGLSQIDNVIERTFQALAGLKKEGIPFYLFEEQRKAAELSYQYQSREDAYLVVEQMASELVYESLETSPIKSRIPSVYDPNYTKAFLQSLNAETCIYFVIANPEKTGVTPSVKERWMGAEYTIREISREKLMAWEQSSINPRIGLPPANPFIPSQLALLTTPETQKDKTISPTLVAQDPSYKVYFAQDTKYLVPETNSIFGFKSPLIDGTARSKVLVDLYLKALTEKLSGTLFFAETAGLNSAFAQQNLELLIKVSGFSDKAPVLIKEIFSSLGDVKPQREHFEIYKQSLLSHYENSEKELPVIQALETMESLVFNDSPVSREKFKALKSISYEEFLDFSHGLFNKSHVDSILYGNLTQKQAVDLCAELKGILKTEAYPEAQEMSRRVLQLPEKHGPFMLVQNTERQGNGAILLLQQGAFSFEKRAAQQVLSKALKESFFETLRTKQQIAYIAKAWEKEEERQLFQLFAVQSSTHHPNELIARFELFLEDFTRNLDQYVTKERFDNLRNMLITSIQMPPENLDGMGDLLYKLGFKYDGDFEWDRKRIDSLQAMTYENFSQWAHLFLKRENTKRLAILVEGFVSPDKDFHYEIVSKEDIKDLGTYVSWK